MLPHTRSSSQAKMYGLSSPQLWTVAAADLQDVHQLARQFLPNPVELVPQFLPALSVRAFLVSRTDI